MNKNLPDKLNDENWLFQFFISPSYRIYRHLLLIVFSVFVLYYSNPEYTEPTETYNRMLIFFQILLLSYINMYIWVPRYLFKSRYTIYGLWIFVYIIYWSFAHRLAAHFFKSNLLPNQDDNINFLSLTFVVIVLSIASASVKLFQQWIKNVQLINELEKSKITSELEQLKNQINPHFLFNMLNNANVLTKKDPEKASQVLMKLSDLLRYQLYDSARDKVLLTSDIHFLEDFLNLEKVRRDNFDFVISKEGNLSGIQIPPLMFISFVENAVKHNNDSSKSSYINIYFKVFNDELFFKCENSKPEKKAVNSESGGLGLANIKRRLELLFPDSHDLKIEENQNDFCVTLNIKL
ncbi:MAG: histidine kinase [Chryseobacterium sp.]|nr:histidine kinase [Chryseobacterium sp.]